jgi:hypothetical protein
MMSREAMQMVLEALENPWEAGPDGVADAIIALRQALEAKPAALRLADALDDEFTQGRISNHSGRKAAVELRRLHEVNQTYHEKVIPKREWVGLKDEEIDILSCETVKGNKSVNWLCKVLEAKLKEKNKW